MLAWVSIQETGTPASDTHITAHMQPGGLYASPSGVSIHFNGGRSILIAHNKKHLKTFSINNWEYASLCNIGTISDVYDI